MQNSQLEVNDEYDKEFILLIMEIEKRFNSITKHNRLRVESWVNIYFIPKCKKLCQVTNNVEWKKNRNLHAICLLDQVLNNKFESPYNKFAPEGSVPIISKAIVKSKLSPKFYNYTSSSYGNEPIPEKNSNGNSGSSKAENNSKNSFKHEASSSNDHKDSKHEIDNVRIQIEQLKRELEMKDEIIQRQNEENRKMEKRIQELEKILDSVMKLNK